NPRVGGSIPPLGTTSFKATPHLALTPQDDVLNASQITLVQRTGTMSSVLTSPFKHPASHIFYFRRSVPRKLRPLIGLHEIKKSLKTKEWLVARPRFFFMQQKCEQLFMSIEKQHPYLPENEALAAVQEWANREIASWKP